MNRAFATGDPGLWGKKRKKEKKWVVIEIMPMTAMTVNIIRGRRRTVSKRMMTIAIVARLVPRNQNLILELSSFSAFVICLSAI